MVSSEWIEKAGDWSDAYAVRRVVFIDEQNVPPDIEMDGSDVNALGLVVYDGGVPAATGRLIEIDGAMTIGRVAVLKEFRGQGLGGFVVRLLIRRAFESGYAEQTAHVQIHAKGFYAKLGFAETGEPYYEAGIPHVTMVHKGDAVGHCR